MSLKDIINMASSSSDLHLRTYSGRGMFGKSCLAISTPLAPQKIIAELLLISADSIVLYDVTNQGLDEWHRNHMLFISDVMQYDVDRIGNDQIIYWRSIPE
jgi:hypothetical protein